MESKVQRPGQVEDAMPRPGSALPEGLTHEVFPRRFGFFGYGRLEARERPCGLRDIGYSPFLAIFRVTGDELGHCVVGFETAPGSAEKESMSLEIANVLVGKFATLLADATGAMVEISPPEQLKQTEVGHRHFIASLQKGDGTTISCLTREYEFITNEEDRVRVRLAYFPAKHGQS